MSKTNIGNHLLKKNTLSRFITKTLVEVKWDETPKTTTIVYYSIIKLLQQV